MIYTAQYTLRTVARVLKTVNVNVVRYKMAVQKETISVFLKVENGLDV